MKKEYRDAWVEALRSGKYEQTISKLRDINGYCCLGVYAEVRGMEISKDGGHIVVDGVNCDYNPLIEEIGDGFIGQCYALNDGLRDRRHSFEEIADFIEKEIPVE